MTQNVNSLSCRAIVLAALFSMASVGAVAAPIYSHDNGLADEQFNAIFSGANNAILGNYFSTQPGYEILSAIDVYWARIIDNALDLFIFSDPNGDGDLSDGSILQSFAVTPTESDLGQFTRYHFAAPITVPKGFFVGVFAQGIEGFSSDVGAPVAADTGVESVTGFSRGIQAPFDFQPLLFDAVTFPDNRAWMIRAVAADVQAVATPGTLPLMALALLMLTRLSGRSSRDLRSFRAKD